MPEATDEVATAARAKHDQAVIDYLEAIRAEIHDLPKRIFGWFFGFGVLFALLYFAMVWSL